jgi:RNA polymerase sigma factor (sigma-70 family)
MPPESDFTELFARARAGCPEAAGALFARYADHVRAVVRRRLDRRLRDRLDSMDVTQDVWLSLLKGPVGRLEFPSERAFLAYLARMAANKIGEEHRRRAALRNGAGRDQPLARGTEPPSSQPTPRQLVVADERLEVLAAGLTPPQRAVLDLLTEGCTHEEIGRRLGIHPKTVQRLLQRIRDRSGH